MEGGKEGRKKEQGECSQCMNTERRVRAHTKRKTFFFSSLTLLFKTLKRTTTCVLYFVEKTIQRRDLAPIDNHPTLSSPSNSI